MPDGVGTVGQDATATAQERIVTGLEATGISRSTQGVRDAEKTLGRGDWTHVKGHKSDTPLQKVCLTFKL